MHLIRAWVDFTIQTYIRTFRNQNKNFGLNEEKWIAIISFVMHSGRFQLLQSPMRLLCNAVVVRIEFRILNWKKCCCRCRSRQYDIPAMSWCFPIRLKCVLMINISFFGFRLCQRSPYTLLTRHTHRSKPKWFCDCITKDLSEWMCTSLILISNCLSNILSFQCPQLWQIWIILIYEKCAQVVNSSRGTHFNKTQTCCCVLLIEVLKMK